MLKGLISRLFGRRSDAIAPADTRASEPVRPAAVQAQGVRASAGDINAAFYCLVAGDPHEDVPAATEQLILESLLRLVKAPDSAASLVPRVPAVIPPLLRSLRDTSLSGSDLARQIAQDVVLVGEVIREANSSYYSPATPVRNLEAAVLMLGQNGLRMLLARVAFRPVISQQSGRLARLSAPPIWAQAEKCALAASMLAYEHGAEPFEAYLAGLMENVGLIVAFRMIDQGFGDKAVLPGSAQFCRGLFGYARMISARIAMLWDFPPNVVTAIAQAGEADGPPLAQALGKADRISKLRLLADSGRVGIDAARAGMDATELQCFDKLKDKEPG
ncbi:HDOD domain-containing protein [Pseudoduganella sp. GCM10020061]|uniref:HDOD domain-containing protein n=1 Tax=Pseudoduganella sp. GCM10020061 TaxID=3317345 RepID=UPI00363CF84A